MTLRVHNELLVGRLNVSDRDGSWSSRAGAVAQAGRGLRDDRYRRARRASLASSPDHGRLGCFPPV